jgi:PAS domain S-box-containing protein
VTDPGRRSDDLTGAHVLGDRLASDEVLRLVIDTAISAVVVMDEDGTVSGWGARAQETFGWSKEEALGSDLAELIVPMQYREAHRRGLETFRKTRAGAVLNTVLEVSALHRDGHEFPVELRISPAAEVAGGILFVAFVLDISERTAARQELEDAVDSLRGANEAIDQFVQSVVHDVRSPLTVARGYLELSLDEASADVRQQQLQTVAAKLDEMSDLIEHVLAASRLNAGVAVTASDIFDARAMAAEAVARARAGLVRRGGTVTMKVPDRPVMVDADARQTGRILDNLLENALAYSADIPEVAVVLDEDCRITVSDRGRGIPEGMHDRIFERFVRVRGGGDRPGTGLGLFIARQLAEQQGGSLDLVESRPSHGSTFRLQLRPADR